MEVPIVVWGTKNAIEVWMGAHHFSWLQAVAGYSKHIKIHDRPIGGKALSRLNFAECSSVVRIYF